MRNSLGLIVAAALLAGACGSTTPNSTSGGGNPTGPTTTTGGVPGTLAFSTTANRGWSSIDINVDGRYIGSISRYLPSQGSTSSCIPVADTRIVTSVAPGSHAYTARTNLGASWSGSASVTNGGCQEVVLGCANGDCSH